MLRMETYYIYILLRNGVVFYVGSTLRTRARLDAHKRTLGFTPEMVIIDELITKARSDVRQLEEYWIHQLRSWGFALKNSRLTTHRFDAQRHKHSRTV